MSRITTAAILFSSLLMLLAAGCSQNPDMVNPLQSSSISADQLTIISGPRDGETLTTDNITIAWNNLGEGYEYRYRIDEGEWSDWTSDTCFTELLDDGDHLMEVGYRSTTNEVQ